MKNVGLQIATATAADMDCGKAIERTSMRALLKRWRDGDWPEWDEQAAEGRGCVGSVSGGWQAVTARDGVE